VFRKMNDGRLFLPSPFLWEGARGAEGAGQLFVETSSGSKGSYRWPQRISYGRSRKLGFEVDNDLDEVVRNFFADDVA
jgi:hypothetical protein